MMCITLKRFGVLRWAGEDGENCVYLWKNPGYAPACKYSHSNGLPLASWDS